MSEHVPDTVTAIEHDAQGNFLARWSRRKSAVRHGVDSSQPAGEGERPFEDAAPATDEDPGARIDVRTGKRYDELTDADMPSLDLLDDTSDLSVFMARNVTPMLRMQALGKVFRSATYNQVCLCAEYADDYTRFEPLGDIIPHDMKSAIAREAEKLRQRFLALDQEISVEDAEARILGEMRGEVRVDTVPVDTRDEQEVADHSGAIQSEVVDQSDPASGEPARRASALPAHEAT